ncbi:PREDICTED: dimethyladenosine transferase 1, mitochondrial-like [Priapulus caudatus]|uniref:rRNA adenine N(6)-methyltransferase n=1 Tax=Priapulus caudatus TaxID=37621 RepID=A0ABM1EHU9_PRICU|nr:PREDICTED: dimethyladenosine transferase 1, mitochondrial-like [Priapulus caudatus]
MATSRLATTTAVRLPPLPTISDLVRLYRLRAQKQLSQNFLMDMNLTDKIVKAAGPLKNGYVCEVGPGPGGITRSILKVGAKLCVVVEKDRRFLPGLQLLGDSVEGRLRIIHGDMLRYSGENLFPANSITEWNSDPPNVHLIGNLPFNVSLPLLVQWLHHMSNHTGPFTYGRTKMTLTFQKEVAQRIVAQINEPNRCRLSVMCQYLCYVKHRFTIPGKAFVPKPDVDVGVVHLVPRIHPRIAHPFKMVEKVVRSVFHFRQKKCKRGIAILFPRERTDLVEEVSRYSGIDPTSRPFQLTVEEYARICDVYANICSREPGIYEYEYR